MRLCLPGMSEAAYIVSPAQLPKQELNKDNNYKHAKMEEESPGCLNPIQNLQETKEYSDQKK